MRLQQCKDTRQTDKQTYEWKWKWNKGQNPESRIPVWISSKSSARLKWIELKNGKRIKLELMAGGDVRLL